MNRGKYALASAVIAFALVEALAIALALMEPEKRALWLIGGLGMPLLWTLAELLNRDKEAIRFSIAGAGVMIGLTFGVLVARAAGLIDPANGDFGLRLAGVASGIIIMGFGNVIPKKLVRFDPSDPARKLALQRFTGWVIVLAGLANALIWAFAPMDRVALWSMVPLIGAIALIVLRCTRWRRARGSLLIAAAFLLAFPPAPPAHAQETWAGDWNGSLTIPGGQQLRLIVTIAAAPGGALSGQMESVDQAPGRKLPIDSIAIADGRLTFAMAALRANYEGRWDAGRGLFAGTFTQSGRAMPLDLARGSGAAQPSLSGLDGVWETRIRRNGVELRLILRVATSAVGTVALFDSPDMLASGLAVTGLTREGQEVRFAVPLGGNAFRGTLSADGTRISGRWSRADYPDTDLVLVRRNAAAAAAPRRPQEPHPPFPYRSEEVSIANRHASGVTLAGTLTLPEGEGPFPAAILISGSGAQDRDESLMGHKPFAVLADYLTRHGIAVLRSDDRGFGRSTGDFQGATSADFATDAAAAHAFLRGRSGIDRDAIGFIGHSEGGLIGPLAAADSPGAAFMVLLAGPGTTSRDLMEAQHRALGQSMGMTEAELDAAAVVQARLTEIAAGPLPRAEAEAAMRAATADPTLAGSGLTPAQRDLLIARTVDPWFRWFLRYDPAPALRRLHMPVLALNGSLDRQVLAPANLAGIRAATAGNPDVTVTELPRLNHLFQTARTGAMGEYAQIEETMAPVVLETVTAWIRARFVRR